MTPVEIQALPYRPNVGIMLVNRQGKVFVAQRLDSPGAAWQMPQGGIDGDETPIAAALRELTEETGIPASLVRVEAETPGWLTYDLPHDLVAKLWKGRWRGQKQRWFLMRFLGEDAQIDINTDHPEFSSWDWVDTGDVLARIVPFKRAVYARVLDQFAPLIG
jgi:putative (di)nucleoside polyphosphate hydrolase